MDVAEVSGPPTATAMDSSSTRMNSTVTSSGARSVVSTGAVTASPAGLCTTLSASGASSSSGYCGSGSVVTDGALALPSSGAATSTRAVEASQPTDRDHSRHKGDRRTPQDTGRRDTK